MTSIEIGYCVPCGLLDNAIETQRALLEEFDQDLEEVTLRPGHDGVFEVRADGETVWDKEVHGGELDLNLVTDAVRERAVAT